MTDYQDAVDNEQGWGEWLISKIPGYSGYKEKEMRREADVLLREKLTADLKTQLTKAEDVTSQLLTGPGIAQLDDMGKGNTRLQTLIDKVKSATQGYSGFFDAIRVKEEDLEALYEFDHSILVQVNQIGKAINVVQDAVDSGESLAKAVRGYIQAVTNLSEQYDGRREQMIALG